MLFDDQVQDVVVALCTVPDEETGRRIAEDVVGQKLAACVNMVHGLRSIYSWKGKVCDDSEVLLVLKTTTTCVRPLAERVATLHPYETPEFITLPVQAGLGAYLAWVREETRP